jgi:hypothetical protein
MNFRFFHTLISFSRNFVVNSLNFLNLQYCEIIMKFCIHSSEEVPATLIFGAETEICDKKNKWTLPSLKAPCHEIFDLWIFH